MSSLKGKRELQARLHAIAKTNLLLRQLQLATIAEAKRRVPRKTGHLGRNILPGHVSTDSATVIVNVNYDVAVEFGTKRHVIVPKNGRVLSWKTRKTSNIAIGGISFSASSGDSRAGRISGMATGAKRPKSRGRAFAMKVNHPGTKAQPFLIPGAHEAVRRHGVDVIVTHWNSAA